MKKYDVWFCSCGRIHFMPMDMYEWMQADCVHRRTIRVCQNCGATIMNYLTNNGKGFDINCCDIQNTEISSTNGVDYRFFFNTGEKIPLKCHQFADAFQGDRFINWEYCEKELGTTYLPDAMEKDPGCCTVDTEALIRMIADEDKLRAMSGYVVGIDWKGTKYAR